MYQKKIVVLDSNTDTAREVSDRLKADGFDVCAVSDDGNEGVRLVEECKPDAVVVGLVLRGLDGFGVLDRIHEMHLPCSVIVTGSSSDDSVVERVMSKGAKCYLLRPVSAEIIAERAREFLSVSEKPQTIGLREKRNASLDEKISNIFISIGIPPHIKGYGYLREGIKMAVEDPSIINNVTKSLYPKIAEKFETTPSKVERAIRHSIEVAWNRQRIDAINAVFGVRVYIGSDKPTNSEFIALVADKLILEGLANMQ